MKLEDQIVTLKKQNSELAVLADFRLRGWESKLDEWVKARHEIVELQRMLAVRQAPIDALRKEVDAHRKARIDANDLADEDERKKNLT